MIFIAAYRAKPHAGQAALAIKIPVTGVTLNQNALTLTAEGNPVTLAATIAPPNATNQNVKWSTDNMKVADVNKTGTVIGLSAGIANITVKTFDGGFTATCVVTVNPATITAIPVITTPVTAADKSVKGTAELGSSVILSINGVAQPAVIASGGNWKVSGLTLAVGDLISVTAQAAGKAISVPATTFVFPASGVDTVPPVIQLIGSNPDSVTIGSTGYADPGAVANDAVYGNLTASITVTGTVDTAVLGTYTLNYSVTDGSGNMATITRTVNVVSPLDPIAIPQFVTPLLIPWAMPKSPTADPNVDYYEIAMRQFNQQILPAGMPTTTVWGYGSATDPAAVFNAPSLTIEAQVNRPVRIKWVNDLIDQNGNYLPHLLPIDQTLHWANPAGGIAGRDMAGTSPLPYVGPVPIVTHVHGAHVGQESDGYPEAWYLPA
ncbi:MAG TPA: immunoglobulin-like domain-containing protein, partial [Bacteroidales bacterium]|nr:immunoglobulin-like domain-containing protein [Bacteroidales bacterium]